jgi:hypothetical protein
VAADGLEAPDGASPREPALGVIDFENGYAGLVSIFRQRAFDQKIAISGASVAETSGLCSNYVAKLLQPNPTKRIGAISLGPLLGVLGLKLVVAPDPKAVAKFGSRLEKSRVEFVHTDALQVTLTRRFLRRIGAIGGKNSRANMSRAQARRLAQRAARARWHGGNGAADR